MISSPRGRGGETEKSAFVFTLKFTRLGKGGTGGGGWDHPRRCGKNIDELIPTSCFLLPRRREKTEKGKYQREGGVRR